MVQMHAILRSNGQNDMTKLTVPYRNCFASAPECCHYILTISNLSESYSVTVRWNCRYWNSQLYLLLVLMGITPRGAKSHDIRGNIFNIECQVTFAPVCMSQNFLKADPSSSSHSVPLPGSYCLPAIGYPVRDFMWFPSFVTDYFCQNRPRRLPSTSFPKYSTGSYNKGQFTHSMPCPCRDHVVPCHAVPLGV
jgi:hypothetical protein